MSSRFHKLACAALAVAAAIVLPMRAMAQMDDDNDPQRVERLESQVATSASEYEMVVSRLLNAPRELVFDVWTDPRHLG